MVSVDMSRPSPIVQDSCTVQTERAHSGEVVPLASTETMPEGGHRGPETFGKPCIRGHRITVQEILEWLSSGASQQQILADYPQLESDDFLAVYAYAAELASGRKVSGG